MLRRQWILHRIVIVMMVLAVLCGCRKHKTVEQPPIAVQVITLKREPITLETRFSATVRERHRVELSFKVPGTIAAMLQVEGPDGKYRDVHEGDVVTDAPNQPLAQLDDSDYQRRLTSAQERLAQAQAKEQAVTATLTAVRANYERIKALRERESVSQQTYDDMLAKRDSVTAELEATRRDVGGAEVAVQQAADDLKQCSLTSPIRSGVVSRKYVETDERVQAGQPVFEIMDLSQVHVVFGVPDMRVNQYHVGQIVTVMADAIRGEKFTGQITKISPAADLRTRTFEVEVTIDRPRDLKPGMVVTIVVGQAEEVVLAPMTAIQRDASDQGQAVFVVVEENGRKIVRRRSVLLDGVYDNRIRILEDHDKVGVGDVIVVAGAFRLSDGQQVRILGAPPIPDKISTQ